VVICLERSADLHIAQLMPLPLTVSSFSKIQIGFTFLVLAHLGSPGQRAVKRVCVCVEELVSRLRSSPLYSNIIMGCFLTIDSLCRGASIEAADFFNIRKKIQNVILGGELWPSYRGDSRAHCQCFF